MTSGAVEAPRTPDLEIRSFTPGSDWVTLHRGLAGRGYRPVLLETLGAPGYSFLAWNPAAVVRVVRSGVDASFRPGVDLPHPARDPARVLSYCERLVRQFRTPSLRGADGRVPFVGGWAGCVSYEWAAAQEGPSRPLPNGVPALWLGLYDRLLVGPPSGDPYLVVHTNVGHGTAAGAMREVRRAERDGSAAGSEARHLPGRPVAEFARPDFEAAVRRVRGLIRAGDVYQVNVAQRYRVDGVDPWVTYRGMRNRNPSPFAGLLTTELGSVASSSPERVVSVAPTPDGRRRATTRPIAGTRPRGPGDQDRRNERSLRASSKERAEHTMLVDLGRNDLGRVCSNGTVEVDEWFTVERYSHVMHLVSNVTGDLRPDAGATELYRALLPGGSVSGTPKIRATEVIADVEPVPRGEFTGSFTYLSFDGGLDANLLIRSAFFPGGVPTAYVYAGAGIVHASDPAREWKETCLKAAAVLEAIGGVRSRGFPWAPPRRLRSWSPTVPEHQHPDCRVLLIDNYDSFTFNLAQYLGALGAAVEVVRNDRATVAELRSRAPTHLVVSPGPGRPEDAGVSIEAVRAFEGTPILGVCLGHQSIVSAYGGVVGEAPVPFHGKSSDVRCVSRGGPDDLLAGLRSPLRVARYHSLVARSVPDVLEVTACTEDGLVMAVQHRDRPTYGVQFHPESILTDGGMRLLDRFLGLTGSGPVAT